VLERSSIDRRKHTRYAVSWGASLTTKSNQIYPGHIYDLGLGGALIRADKHIVADDPITIAIKTPLLLRGWQNYIPRIECEISYNKQTSEYNMYQVGLKFLNLQGIKKHMLAEALFKQFKLFERRTLTDEKATVALHMTARWPTVHSA